MTDKTLEKEASQLAGAYAYNRYPLQNDCMAREDSQRMAIRSEASASFQAGYLAASSSLDRVAELEAEVARYEAEREG